MSRAILSVDLRGEVNLEHGGRKRDRHVLEMMFRIALQCQLSKEAQITPRLGYCVRGRVKRLVDNGFRRGDEEPALRLGLEERYRRSRVADPCRMIFMRSRVVQCSSGDAPLGSNPTISNSGPKTVANAAPAPTMASTPLPPGPPGLNRIGPRYSDLGGRRRQADDRNGRKLGVGCVVVQRNLKAHSSDEE